MGASATAYLLFDADATSDHLKAVELKTDSTAEDADGNAYNFQYFAEVGASNAGVSSATGTVTIAIEEGTVTGSSTTFLSYSTLSFLSMFVTLLKKACASLGLCLLGITKSTTLHRDCNGGINRFL